MINPSLGSKILPRSISYDLESILHRIEACPDRCKRADHSSDPYQRMNLCTRSCCDYSRLADRQDVMQGTSRVFAKNSRDFALQKHYRGIGSANRGNSSPLDDFQCNALNVFNLYFIYEEMNCKGSVAACLPWNVRIQPNKPRKVGGFESSLDQILKKNRRSVSSASAFLGISVVDSDV